MSSFSWLEWEPPRLFLTWPDPEFLTVFMDGGCLWASVVIYPPLQKEQKPTPLRTISYEVEGLPQFKELFAVVLALYSIPEPLTCSQPLCCQFTAQPGGGPCQVRF